MPHSDIEKAAMDLQMSPNMQRLTNMLGTLPNTDDDEATREAFTTCLVDLTKALDKNRIRFKKMEDRAMFYGLLTLALKISLGHHKPELVIKQ